MPIISKFLARVEIGGRRLAQIAILALAAFVLWLSYRLNTPTDTWWSSLLQNFGAGLCSALVLIWLYDYILEREAEKIKIERNRVAAVQLVVSLRSQIYGLLFPMYRSAISKKPENRIETWGEFLALHFPQQVPYLDISIRSPGSYPHVMSYPTFINQELSRFSNELQSWLDKYVAVVDADLFEAVEQVRSSAFMRLGCSLEAVANFVPPSFPATYSFTREFRFHEAMLREYGTRLSRLIEVVEQRLPSQVSRFEEEYWHNAIFEIGYARRASAT